ncbi:MAG: hypothetical protein ACI97A_002432 [Planctomycetota bacterium]|jgi:hypothetical protein
MNNTKQKFIILSFFLVTFIPVMLCGQTTRTVPSTYPTIQAAIGASVDGDTVSISPGTYYENIDFLGKAITVEGAWGANLTTIDGSGAGSVVSFRNDEVSTSILRNLTITNGRGVDGFGIGHAGTGGGIDLFCASPSIYDCIIINNRGGDAAMGALGGGGGIGGEGPCPETGVHIFRTRILNNQGGSAMAGYGIRDGRAAAGGLHFIECVSHLHACVVSNNQGGDGAFSSVSGGAGGVEYVLPHGVPTITDCIIADNTAGHSFESVAFAGAGGVHGASPIIRETIIKNNQGGFAAGLTGSTSGGAGGVFGVAPKLINCIIVGNIGGDAGVEPLRAGAGGVYVIGDAYIESCMINCNQGGTDGAAPGFGGGGGVHALAGNVEIISSTIADNIGGGGFDGNPSGGVHSDFGSITMRSSIVWGNTLGPTFIPYTSANNVGGPVVTMATFCDIEGGYIGSGNTNVTPGFIDRPGGDYMLKPTSGCIDYGDYIFRSVDAMDIGGDPRVLGARVDIGADEVNLDLYPGSNEDLILETVVEYWGSPQASSRFVEAGNFVTMGIRSPAATFAPSTFVLLGEVFTTGFPPAPVAGFPELRITPGAFFLLAPGSFEAWSTPYPDGTLWGFDVPMSFPGFSLMVQGFAQSPSAANGFFAATQGHELRFR